MYSLPPRSNDFMGSDFISSFATSSFVNMGSITYWKFMSLVLFILATRTLYLYVSKTAVLDFIIFRQAVNLSISINVDKNILHTFNDFRWINTWWFSSTEWKYAWEVWPRPMQFIFSWIVHRRILHPNLENISHTPNNNKRSNDSVKSNIVSRNQNPEQICWWYPNRDTQLPIHQWCAFYHFPVHPTELENAAFLFAMFLTIQCASKSYECFLFRRVKGFFTVSFG